MVDEQERKRRRPGIRKVFLGRLMARVSTAVGPVGRQYEFSVNYWAEDGRSAPGLISAVFAPEVRGLLDDVRVGRKRRLMLLSGGGQYVLCVGTPVGRLDVQVIPRVALEIFSGIL